MLYTIAVVLIILWLLGLVSSYTMGGFIHVLLVIAVVVVLLRIIQGRRVLWEAVSLSYWGKETGGSMRPKTIIAGILIVLGIRVMGTPETGEPTSTVFTVKVVSP
jgi:hypothetical protein